MSSPDGLDELLFARMRAKCVKVADGVLADVLDNGVWVEVRGVMADEPRIPGAVGAWLDALPRRRVVVPDVVSDRLAAMLVRRGFALRRWYDHRMSTFTEAYIRPPPHTTTKENTHDSR